ncbi:MAG: hypothetical protein ACRD5K_19245 [Candidatus Acidiferrales bacterium]
MRTQTCGEYEIEDLLGHPAEMIEELRERLSENANIIPDPRRAGFYEVQSADSTYYIHVIPNSGKVLLLAAWPSV